MLPDGILTNSSLQAVRNWLLEKFQLLAVVSLPQFAFAHYGAGVKASIVFLRKRGENEIPQDYESIFMAIAENIGYDATGRKTFKIAETREAGDRRTEVHRCDLFDVEVVKERASAHADGEEAWTEKSRRVLPQTGILGQFRAFEKNPNPFFV